MNPAHLTAGRQCGVGHGAHQPDSAAPVDDTVARQRDRPTECLRFAGERRIAAGIGPTEDTDPLPVTRHGSQDGTSTRPGTRRLPRSKLWLMTTSDLQAAAAAIDLADTAIAKAIARLTELGGPDQQQVFAYELAHAGAGIATAKAMLDYGAKGDVEASLTCGFAADAIHDLITKLIGREELWGVDAAMLADVHDFVGTLPRPRVPGLAGRPPLARAPRRRHGDGAGHVPFVRRRRDRAARRTRAPHQRRRARGDRVGPRRDRRVRAQRARRVRRLQRGRRRRVPRRWSSPPRSSAGPASASAAR